MKQGEVYFRDITEEELTTAKIMWVANTKNIVTADEYMTLLYMAGYYEESEEVLLQLATELKGKKTIMILLISMLEQIFGHTGNEVRELIVDAYWAVNDVESYKSASEGGLYAKEFNEYVMSRSNMN